MSEKITENIINKNAVEFLNIMKKLHEKTISNKIIWQNLFDEEIKENYFKTNILINSLEVSFKLIFRENPYKELSLNITFSDSDNINFLSAYPLYISMIRQEIDNIKNDENNYKYYILGIYKYLYEKLMLSQKNELKSIYNYLDSI